MFVVKKFFVMTIAIVGVFIHSSTASLGVKKYMLDDIGFSEAHKMGFTGSEQHAIVSEEKIYLDHPSFTAVGISEIYDSGKQNPLSDGDQWNHRCG